MEKFKVDLKNGLGVREIPATSKEEALAKAKVLAEQLLAQTAQPRQAVPTQRVRTAAQGATFGTSDEMEALARAPFEGRPYGEIKQEINQGIDAYKKDRPVESTMYEMGGAMVPGIAAAPLTGGTSLVGTAGRTALAGGLAASAYGAGTAEGNTMQDRLYNSGMRAVESFVPGAVGATVASGGVQLAGKGLVGLVDYTRRWAGSKAASAVEAEVQRLAQNSGLTVDEIIDRVGQGELMAEMSDTLQHAARRYKAEGGPHGAIIANTFKPPRSGVEGFRARHMRDKAMGNIKSGVAPGMDDNVLKRVKVADKDLADAENEAYNRIWSRETTLPLEHSGALSEIARRAPRAGAKLTENYQAQTGRSPWVRYEKDGQAVFDRQPTLQEAEIFRRSLDDISSQSFREGAGGTGSTFRGLEQDVRAMVDEVSDELATTRAQAAARRSNKDAFELGRTALTRSPDQVSMEVEGLVDNPEQLRYYRYGVMDALRTRNATGSGPSMMGALSDPARKEGQVLRMVLPPETVEGVMGSVKRAAQSQRAQGVITEGSPTAQSMLEGAQQANGAVVADVSGAMSLNPASIARVVDRGLNALGREMSQAQKVQIAKLLVEEDPEVLRRALTDDSGVMLLQRKLQGLVDKVSGGTKTAVPEITISVMDRNEKARRGLLD
jgi:hypothetical protein